MPSSLHYGYSKFGVESNLILSRINSHSLDMSVLSLEIKRQERRRRLAKHGNIFNDDIDDDNSSSGSSRKNSTTPSERLGRFLSAEVKEKIANVSYLQGEKEQERYSRELEQWVRKMKCSGMGGMRLEQFREIKVGVDPSPLDYNCPCMEPYPNIHKEDFKYHGGKDSSGKWKGKAVIEFKNGDTIVGYFQDGLRHGECKIETNRKNLRAIIGTYDRGRLSGKCKLIFKDETWLEGFFKDGVLHGFARYFDAQNRLTFIGNHKNGRPFGVCWKIIKDGGCVVGRVDEQGELSGIRIAYIYPDFRTALVGTFTKGVLESAQVAHLKTAVDDKGIKVPIFSEPQGSFYEREIATYDCVTSTPLLPDPYESRMVEVRKSSVPGANDGLFAKIRIEPSTVIAFYNGKPINSKSPEYDDLDDWDKNAYKIFDPARKNGTIDIPECYRDLCNYNATLAHKTNHSFLPNAEFVTFDHPKYGLIPCLSANHVIEKDEEIFVHYGYELEGCPEWYEETWLKGTYPVPDSLKDGWEITVRNKSSMVEDSVMNSCYNNNEQVSTPNC